MPESLSNGRLKPGCRRPRIPRSVWSSFQERVISCVCFYSDSSPRGRSQKDNAARRYIFGVFLRAKKEWSSESLMVICS